jgi:hypothetical protein
VSEDLKPNEVTQETAVSRREFGAVSLAAGLAVVAGAGAAEAAERPLTETEVTVKTPDGNCDAAFIHPTTGTFPGVLIWPDAFGLRPAMRQIGRLIASEGHRCSFPIRFTEPRCAGIAKDAGATVEVPFTPGRMDASQEQTDVEPAGAPEGRAEKPLCLPHPNSSWASRRGPASLLVPVAPGPAATSTSRLPTRGDRATR